MMSSAEMSRNRRERSRICALACVNSPVPAEDFTMAASSFGLRALASSSAGSMPKRCSTKFARLFSQEMKPRKNWLKAHTGRIVNRATLIGSVIAKFFGTSSPKIMERAVARMTARVSAIAIEAECGMPNRSSIGVKNFARIGSARKPVARVVIVMPSWAPESIRESSPWAFWIRRAGPSFLSLTCWSIVDLSRPVMANSIPTNSPVPAVSAMKPARPRMLSSMSIFLRSCPW